MSKMYVEVSFYIDTKNYDDLIEKLDSVEYEYDVTDTTLETDDNYSEW